VKWVNKCVDWNRIQNLNYCFQKLFHILKLRSLERSLDITEEEEVARCEIRGIGWIRDCSQAVIFDILLNSCWDIRPDILGMYDSSSSLSCKVKSANFEQDIINIILACPVAFSG
jgi:hypothetical protein